MPTLTAVPQTEIDDEESWTQRTEDALDLDNYTEIAVSVGVSNLSFTSGTTLEVQLMHAARNRASDYVALGNTIDWTAGADPTHIAYHTEFSRYLRATARVAGGGSASYALEVLVVPKS